MRARRTDATQAEIVRALRRVGCLVWEINGAVDLAVQRGDRIFLLECKTLRRDGGRQTLTKTQERMRAEGWRIGVVWSPEGALEAVGL